MRSVWAFVWSPVRFFETRAQTAPDWVWAGVAPVLCGVLQVIATVILAGKIQEVLAAALPHMDAAGALAPPLTASALTTVAGYPVAFGFCAMALICLDVLLVDSRRAPQLAACAGYTFYTQVPAAVLLIVAVCCWSPLPLIVDAGSPLAGLQRAAFDYREAVRSAPLFVIADSVADLSLLWFAAMLGVALRVVSGVSIRAAVLSASLLWLTFGGVRRLVWMWFG
jgi:hypothetical protein